jgi:hypothetical protein
MIEPIQRSVHSHPPIVPPAQGFLSPELGWCDPQTGCSCTKMKAPVPYSNDQTRIPDGQGTSKMYRIRAGQGMPPGQLAGLALHGLGGGRSHGR